MTATIPVQRLQALYKRCGLTPSQIALRADWVTGSGKPDSSRVMRRLGLKQDGSRKQNISSTCNYSTAVTLVRAMGFDPVDAGL